MGLTNTALALQVADLIGLPRHYRSGKAYKVVQTIGRVLTTALQRGEKVSIDGFGTFEIYERPATRKYLYFYPYLKKKGLHGEVVSLPPTKRVIFKPSKALTRFINEEPKSCQKCS